MAEKVPIREGMFREGPSGMILLAGKCKTCGQVFFPKTPSCLSCGNDMTEEISLSKKGKLYSYSVVQMPSSHFKPPYAVGYVDMPEGVRIFGQLDMVEEKPFQVGMAMKVYVDTLWQEENKEIFGYRFSPILSAE